MILIIGKGLAGLAAVTLVAAVVFVLVVLPRLPSGAHDMQPFGFDRKMEIKKRAANGTSYTVNNSTATFHLDLAKPDAHSEQVFTNYTAALTYCREHGLPVMPSVQLIQGRLKQFDDTLCAALELGMVKRQVQALERLLAVLVRDSNAEAAEHVATALLLAGVEPNVDQDMRHRAEASRDAFLATPDARPIGFWDGDERLRRCFQSDRYLMQGFLLHESPETCVTISRAIVGDAELKEAFQRMREFGAKLTNPPQTVPFETLAALTPEGVVKRFPRDAKFALVAYSVSKEQTLIERLTREGKLRRDESLMALIIEAVRSGLLSLEPKPDSGWYDYQWHALETLLSPERGRESAKLRLSDAYKKRLETAFSAVLVKERETHVKRLPIITIIGTIGKPDKPPPKVMVEPEFSAEPTPTVYLRFGRGYRFLRQALRATLGDEAWSRFRRPSSDRSVDAELQEMAWFCYGLYEKLCMEIGQHPAYLAGEMSAEDRVQAVAVFDRWSGAWQDDLALAADTRVAAPIARWPNGRVRYWATAGVRLEPVRYEYQDKPMVSGEAEAVFEASTKYLPTDMFLEFERGSPETLTRAEFRALCDSCRDTVALQRSLSATTSFKTPKQVATVGRWFTTNLRWIAAAVIALVFWRMRRARLWLSLGCIALSAAWGCLIAFSPVYRTAFIVRHIASVNVPLGMICENVWIRRIPAVPRVKGLSKVISDSDPQVRYLAARFMESGQWMETVGDSNAWHQVGVRDAMLCAANDPLPEIACTAVAKLGWYHDREVADFLLAKLASDQAYDELLIRVIDSLGSVGDPRAISALVTLCEDSRTGVSYSAMWALGQLPQEDAHAHLWRLAESPCDSIRTTAVRTIRDSCYAWWRSSLSREACEAKCDAMMAERVRNSSLQFKVRLSHAWNIEHNAAKLEAGEVLLGVACTGAQTNEVLTCLAVDHVKKSGFWGGVEEMAQLVSNAATRVELAKAVVRKDPQAIKLALETILVAAKDSPDSDKRARRYALRALKTLQDKSTEDE